LNKTPSAAKSRELVVSASLSEVLSVSSSILDIPCTSAASNANLQANVSAIKASRTGLTFAAPAITDSPPLFLIMKPQAPALVSALKAPSVDVYFQPIPSWCFPRPASDTCMGLLL
jgi:hypothetical protein